VHVVRSDGTDDRNVTNDGFNNVYPGWTPDGRVVYGQTQRGGTAHAYTVASDGSGKRPLLAITSPFACYSPDATRIAYLEARAETGVAVVLADRAGRVITTVPLDKVGDPP